MDWHQVTKREFEPVFQISAKEVETYFYFPNYTGFNLNAEFATADEFDNPYNEASETPILIKEFSFF